MSSQHLSDEAVAAFADGVLSGHARDRAARHLSGCPECAHAVAVQREAVWALRAAPAPSLPVGLVDRLRSVPITTPVTNIPSAFDEHGSALLSTFMPMSAAALVPSRPSGGAGVASAVRTEAHRLRPIAVTAMAVAAAGLLAVGSDFQASSSPAPVTGQFTGFVQNATPGSGATVIPANARVRTAP